MKKIKNNFLKLFKNSFSHTILTTVSILSVFPFLWLLSTALKGKEENIFSFPPVFIPEHITFENFVSAWHQVPFLLYFFNSFLIASITVIANLILSSLAAYPLARMNFKGKKPVFYFILSTLTVPFQAIMLPVYIIILKMNLTDSSGVLNGYIGLFLPFAVNAFGIFLLRSAFLQIPKDLEEQAFIDGANVFQIWQKILLPMIKPQLALLAIFTFIGSWGEFLWPSIVISNQNLYTLPVGINNLQGMFSSNWRIIASGSLISIIPIVVFFFSMQKYFIQGTNEGSVK